MGFGFLSKINNFINFVDTVLSRKPFMSACRTSMLLNKNFFLNRHLIINLFCHLIDNINNKPH